MKTKYNYIFLEGWAEEKCGDPETSRNSPGHTNDPLIEFPETLIVTQGTDHYPSSCPTDGIMSRVTKGTTRALLRPRGDDYSL